MNPNDVNATVPTLETAPTVETNAPVATQGLETPVSEQQMAELQKLEESNNAYFNSQGGVDKVKNALEEYNARLAQAQAQAKLREDHLKMRKEHSTEVWNDKLEKAEQIANVEAVAEAPIETPTPQSFELPQPVIDTTNTAIRSALRAKYPELADKIDDGSFFKEAQSVGVVAVQNKILNQSALEKYADNISVYAKQAQQVSVSSNPKPVSQFANVAQIPQGQMTKAKAMEIINAQVKTGQAHPEFERAKRVFMTGIDQ